MTTETRCTGTDCPGCEAARQHYREFGCTTPYCAPEAHVARWSTDPDWYLTTDDCESKPTFILMQVYDRARKIYYTCGGHKLADRMLLAMRLTQTTLGRRGYFPEFLGGLGDATFVRWVRLGGAR